MAGWNKRHKLIARWMLASSAIASVAIVWTIAMRKPADEAVIPGADVEGLTAVLNRDSPAIDCPIRFDDVTDRAGVEFRHFPNERESLLPEDMGSGVAWGDYDNDGFIDLLLVNFAHSVLPEKAKPKPAGRTRLYRNVDGQHFEDVSDRAGILFAGLGMGASWGDYDNDRDLDLYIAGLGRNVLYRNNGDGTFTDVTDSSGAQDVRFGAGCTWADFDRDGYIDLYVTNYVNFVFRPQDRDARKPQYSTEQPYTLNPSAYEPQPNSLFRNNGDGTFTDVAAKAGIDNPEGRSLSAGWADMDNDGWPDLYVANDVSNNGVFRNRGDGTFEDVGPSSLAADYRGAMGIAFADIDNDLDLDLLITHWIAQENALFRNMTLDALLGNSKDNRLWFMDHADDLGLGQISLDMVGWATGLSDLDNDGLRDLWLVNGNTLERIEDHSQLEPQPSFIFWNLGNKGFADVATQASSTFASPHVARGGAHADFNRDGLVDIAVLRHAGKAVLFQNTSTSKHHWIRFDLRQTNGNTFAIGARLYITAGENTQMAEVGSSSSYLSQHESTLHFGLGDASVVDEVKIVWPDGAEQVAADVQANQVHVFEHAAQYPVASNKE